MTYSTLAKPRHLIAGLDSLYMSYYLDLETSLLDFEDLAFRKLMLADREPGFDEVTLGSERFLLKPYGKKPYRYVLVNDAFEVALAERLKPSVSVQFMSKALWHEGANGLHERMLAWAESLKAYIYQPETVSRADWAFDFALPRIDFAEDNFLSRARKDNKWRDAGEVQTFQFGTGDTVIRVYNKRAEIEQVSGKVWFYDLWAPSLRDLPIAALSIEGEPKGQPLIGEPAIGHTAIGEPPISDPIGKDGPDIWRVEFQVRRDRLREAGINSYSELTDFAGDLLRDLAGRHTTLRQPSGDSNKARWALHPLWVELQAAIEAMPAHGLLRAYREQSLLDYRLSKVLKSVYGYTKGLAVLMRLLQDDKNAPLEFDALLSKLPALLKQHHAPTLWREEVDKRVREYEFEP